MQSNTPASNLTDAVQNMDKSTRWGQLEEAARMVDPTYRAQFVANHKNWGRAIQVGESDIANMELAPGGDTAISLVAYHWYLTSAMTLHQTAVRQRWTRAGKTYALISEAVVQGDPRLFASDPENAPAPMSSETSLFGMK